MRRAPILAGFALLLLAGCSGFWLDSPGGVAVGPDESPALGGVRPAYLLVENRTRSDLQIEIVVDHVTGRGVMGGVAARSSRWFEVRIDTPTLVRVVARPEPTDGDKPEGRGDVATVRLQPGGEGRVSFDR